jgi:hypothetical protein
MKASPLSLSVAVLATAVFLAFQPAARAGDKAAVQAATAQFYAALNTMFTGELGPMKQVWSHRADVTYMGPGGGMQVGWKKVLSAWKAQAARKVSIRATNIFRKENGVWKMIGHHTDLLPYVAR